MPLVQTGFDPYSGTLSATQQGDALSGASGPAGGGDFGGIVGAVLAERKRKEAQARMDAIAAQNRAALANRPMLSTLQMRNRAAAENAAAIEGAQGAAAQARTLTERGPQSYIRGLGYIGGPNQTTANVSQMTGAQRKAYLPEEAGMEDESEASKQAAALSAANDAAFRREFTGEAAAGRRASLAGR